MKLKPLGNRALIIVEKEEEKTISGIILPDSLEKKEKSIGKIISIGDGESINNLGIKIKDTVVFGKYAGEDLVYDDIEYKFLNEDEILAILTK